MREKKNKKIASGEGFSISSDVAFGVTLAELLGKEKPAAVQKSEETSKQTLEEASASKGASETETSSAKISHVSLRRERAGRGGKTVTIVTLPKDHPGDVAALAKELRKGLGCGSSLEDGKIVLQGDITDRVEAGFAKKGVTKITKSGV